MTLLVLQYPRPDFDLLNIIFSCCHQQRMLPVILYTHSPIPLPCCRWAPTLLPDNQAPPRSVQGCSLSSLCCQQVLLECSARRSRYHAPHHHEHLPHTSASHKPWTNASHISSEPSHFHYKTPQTSVLEVL